MQDMFLKEKKTIINQIVSTISVYLGHFVCVVMWVFFFHFEKTLFYPKRILLTKLV